MDKVPDYGVVGRIKLLRDLLRQGACTKSEIFRSLPQYYQVGIAGSRRLGRDVRSLRELGYLITSDQLTHRYSLQEAASLQLDDDDVGALCIIRDAFEGLVPVSEDVLRVLEKIEPALPEYQRKLYRHRAAITIQMQPASDYSLHLRTIQLLTAAIEQGRKVRFVYPALQDGKPVTHINVEPQEIRFFDRQYYLIGLSPHSVDVMEFRVNRMQDLELMPGRVGGRRKRSTLPFVYRLSPAIARLGVSERFLNQRVEYQEDGSAIVHAEGYGEFRIIQEMLRYGEQAEILEPSSLRGRMRKVVAAMNRVYA
jgi:predicted DNA-binding transcriptional regulator YafY